MSLNSSILELLNEVGLFFSTDDSFNNDFSRKDLLFSGRFFCKFTFLNLD